MNNIGVFRGARDEMAWLKILLPHGGRYKGKPYKPGHSLEIKVGRLASWSWAQLEAERDRLQGLADRDEPLEEAEVPLFKEWVADWLQRAASRIKAHDTAKGHLEKHLLPHFKDLYLNEIDRHTVNQWVAEQLKTLKPATVKRQLATLSSIITDAVKSGKIKENPCQFIDPIKGIKPRQRFLEHGEINTLLLAASQICPWLEDFILWALHSGMRKGEMLALQWENIRQVDDKQLVLIEHSKSDRPRFVTCSPTITQILERRKAGSIEDETRIFPYADITLRRRWQACRKQAGIEDVTLHDLRRTQATYLASAGVDLRTLAARIGHADLGMLEKHYAAVVNSAEAEAAQTVEAVFGKYDS